MNNRSKKVRLQVWINVTVLSTSNYIFVINEEKVNFISGFRFSRQFYFCLHIPMMVFLPGLFFFTSLVYVDTLYGMPSRYDRYSELVLTESIVLLDIDDKELPNSLPDICLCMLCLAKEDANPANPFLFDLASGCRATKG